MYKLNSELMVREDDMSLFSLKDMEVYEFNKEGFQAIMVVFQHPEGIEYDLWEKKVSLIDGIDAENIIEFWNCLIEKRIITEVC